MALNMNKNKVVSHNISFLLPTKGLNIGRGGGIMGNIWTGTLQKIICLISKKI